MTAEFANREWMMRCPSTIQILDERPTINSGCHFSSSPIQFSTKVRKTDPGALGFPLVGGPSSGRHPRRRVQGTITESSDRRYFRTVRETVAVCVMLPPVPVTVIVYVPVAAVRATFMVMVEVPASSMDAGLKVTVTPAG